MVFAKLVEDLMEVPRLVERMKQWEKDWYRQGYAKGLREGRAKARREARVEGRRQGQHQLMVRMAGTKFGPAVARRLEAALAEVTDPARTAAISVLVLHHDTGDEFMAAVRRTAAAAHGTRAVQENEAVRTN